MAKVHAVTGSGGISINVAQVTTCLNVPELHTRLLFDALLSLAPPHLQPSSSNSDLQVDVHLLLIFLVLQAYHRPSTLRTGDTWPAGDIPPGSPPSPEHIGGSPVKSSVSLTAARSKVSTSTDDAAQYSYIIKHIPAILDLLKQGDARNPSISVARFNLIGLLIHCPGAPTSDTPLSASCPLLNKPDVDAVPLSAVQDWLTQNIGPATPSVRLGPSSRPHGTGVASSGHVIASSAPAGGAHMEGHHNVSVEGVCKSTVVQRESDIGHMADVRIVDCQDTVVYLLAPMRHVLVCGCTDCVIVVGPVAGSLKVELCERVHLVSASRRLRISSCHDSVFCIATSHPPLVHGDCRNLQLAPYNTYYEQLESHLRVAGIKTAPNYWDAPLNITAAPAAAVPARNGVELVPHSPDSGKMVVSLLPPEKFLPFTVPFRSIIGGAPARGAEGEIDPTRRAITNTNPFTMPQAYASALQTKVAAVEELRRGVKEGGLDTNTKRDFQTVVQAHFKEWLVASGNMRQVYDLARMERGEV
eukprot:CAMPEP_0196586400 /NCGR_PEP_ID=MMETSP1081-20130531/54119_1 /TAXON_ID=36882 /ORGANISM="Pyramimonas amylifera, Strain CCMP720" /LENGTH=527 /DNA_ID=CAMNT_0041908267 /DNA_START=73 /DNA_END=1656 /DNA_ORIENTATION=-